MPYYPFSEGSLTIAEQMMSNYYHIADGNQYPYSVSANNGFTLAASTAYNLGASTSVFQDAHCVSLHISDSIASADKSVWRLVAEETLTDTATSITFSLTSGFDGDSCEVYRIYCKHVVTSETVVMIINGDSAANYGFQQLRGSSNAVSAIRSVGNAVGFMGGANIATITSNHTEILVHAKTGNERLLFVNNGNGCWGDFVYEMILSSYIWNDTSNTLTSFKFYPLANCFLTGTNIQVWGRV